LLLVLMLERSPPSKISAGDAIGTISLSPRQRPKIKSAGLRQRATSRRTAISAAAIAKRVSHAPALAPQKR